MIATKRIAIFGGSFDPIHFGHIHLVEQILKSKRFSEVIVVPAGDPWQKIPEVSAQLRLEMARLAFAELPVTVSDIEVLRSGPSYAIDTVRQLKRSFPDAELTWIVGSDVISSLSSWHEIDTLVREVEFLIVKRPGANADLQLLPKNLRFKEIEIDALDISATQIRNAFFKNEDVASLVPDIVAGFIKSKGLYGAA